MGVKEEERHLAGETRMAVAGACIRGVRHIQTGDPCQDAWYSSMLDGGGVVVAVADGLSSAVHAQKGAMIAVSEACKSITPVTARSFCPEELVRTAVEKSRDAVLCVAAAASALPSSYASTLIIAYYHDEILTVGHIGDGIVAGIKDGEPLIISPPARSEYINETASLTQPDWRSHLRISICGHVDSCIIATDGCQGALSVRKGTEYLPYDPFVIPLISFIRKKLRYNGDCTPDIENLLISPRMQELSDDDKTLVILLRTDPASSR